MNNKNLYNLGRTISIWLTGFYCFWIAFIVSIPLARDSYVLPLGIVFLFFLIIGFGLLAWFLIIIKRQLKQFSQIWKKIILLSFLPFLYFWVIKKYL